MNHFGEKAFELDTVEHARQNGQHVLSSFQQPMYQSPFNFTFPYDPMSALPDVDDPIGGKFSAPYTDAVLDQQGPVFEFCTPNQQGAVDPVKAAPLEDLSLPPPVFHSTPITTPATPAVHNPAPEVPVFTDLPAACQDQFASDISQMMHALPPAITEDQHVTRTPVRRTPRSRPTSSRSANQSPRTPAKEIPTQLPPFQISPELQCDLAGGPHRGNRRTKTHHTDEEAGVLLDRLYQEAENYAEKRKIEVRDYLKQDLQNKQDDLDSRKRSLLRSRREAKVSRVKNDEYSQVLKEIIRYLIVNADTRRPDNCVCKKTCGKRKAPPA